MKQIKILEYLRSTKTTHIYGVDSIESVNTFCKMIYIVKSTLPDLVPKHITLTMEYEDVEIADEKVSNS